MEPFFKSGEKKKRQNDLNDECQCFDFYKNNKDSVDRFVTEIEGVSNMIAPNLSNRNRYQ